MPALVKLLVFLAVSAVGAFAVPLLVNLALLLGMFPMEQMDNPGGAFPTALGYGLLVWGVCALIGLRYFFVGEEKQTWSLLLLPLYGPALYGLAVLTYFSAI